VSAFGHLSSVAPHLIWDGVVGRTVEAERATLALVEVAPNSVVPEHAHENEQFGMLISGSLRFRIGDEESELEPGGTWVIPPNAPHRVETGPQGAVLVECFAPARADWAQLERLAASPPRWSVADERSA
jgi:quercetin dioxygenase-like cupin family protein